MTQLSGLCYCTVSKLDPVSLHKSANESNRKRTDLRSLAVLRPITKQSRESSGQLRNIFERLGAGDRAGKVYNSTDII